MALDPLSIGLQVFGSIIDKIWPNKDEADKVKVRMMELAQAGQLEELKLIMKQIEVNMEEAKSSSKFIAGWRPFVGWVCASAFGYYYVAQPFLVWLLSIFHINTEMPALNMGELMTLLFGILGLGAYRSYDKLKANGKASG